MAMFAGSCSSSGVTLFGRRPLRVCQKESAFSRNFTVRCARNKVRKIAQSSNMKVARLLMRFAAKVHWFIYHDDTHASRSKCEARRERVHCLIELFGAALEHAAAIRYIFYKEKVLTISELLSALLMTHVDKHGQLAGACEWRSMPDFEALQAALHTVFERGRPTNPDQCVFDEYISFVLDFKNCESVPSSCACHFASFEQSGYTHVHNYAATMNYFDVFNEVRTIDAFRDAVLELIANQRGPFNSHQLFTIESLPERYFRIIEALEPIAKNEADRTLAAISIGLLRRAASLSRAGLWLQDTLDATGRVRFEIERLTDARRADEAFLRALASVFCWQRAALLDGELVQRAATWTDRPYYVDFPALRNRAGIVHNFHSVAFYHIVRFLVTFSWVQRAMPTAALPIVMKLLSLNYALLDDARRIWFQDELVAFAASRCAASAPPLLETVKQLLETNAFIAESATVRVASLQDVCRLTIWKAIRFTDYSNDVLNAHVRRLLPPRLTDSILEPILI